METIEEKQIRYLRNGIGIVLILILVYLKLESNKIKHIDILKNSKYKGVIMNKYIDSSNHCYKVIRFTNNKKTTMSLDVIYNDLKKGDSLVKKKGEIALNIYKKDTLLVRELIGGVYIKPTLPTKISSINDWNNVFLKKEKKELEKELKQNNKENEICIVFSKGNYDYADPKELGSILLYLRNLETEGKTNILLLLDTENKNLALIPSDNLPVNYNEFEKNIEKNILTNLKEKKYFTGIYDFIEYYSIKTSSLSQGIRN